MAREIPPPPDDAWPGEMEQAALLEGAKAAVDKVGRIFEKAGMSQNYKGLFFEAPHEFNLEMQEKAFDWLKEKLKEA
jgi:hypothetical protein